MTWDKLDDKAKREGEAIRFLKSLERGNIKSYHKAYYPHRVLIKESITEKCLMFRHPLRLLIYRSKK